MADKRLRVIVEAMTSQAQAAFKSMGNMVRGFSDQASRDMGKVTGATEGAGQSMISLGQVVAVGVAGIVTAYGKMTVEAAVSMAKMAADNLDLGEQFTAVTNRMNIDGQELVEALQAAARGTIGAYQTMGMAIKAVDLGIAASTDDLVKLMEIAHVRAKRYGMSTAEAFELLVNGISSGRPMMLRHLGFLADTEQAYDRVARSMGKDADELTLLQQKQAVFQAILETGQPDLEAWVNTADDASDAFGRQEVAMAKLRQELGERFLPAVTTVTEAMTDLIQVSLQMENPLLRERTVFGDLVKEYGTIRAATIAYAENVEIASQGMIDHEQAMEQARAAAKRYTDALEGAPWGQMYQDSARARMALQQLGDTSDDTAQDLEKLALAQDKAAGIMADYGRSVTEETWRYTQRVDDAMFSMKQGAERALFDMMKIEREAAERKGDLLESESIRDEAQTASHYDKLRYLKQDLMDSLMDMEWDYQQERRQAMDKAPWWIRQTLSKEFAERERIAATGDREALEQYDKALMERIKAIDPVYTKELGLLDEQYEHKEDIERREGRQSLDREEDAWRISEREQRRSLDQQLRVLERELGEQREEWSFHNYQRNEAEQRSMDQLGIEYEHFLANLWTTTQLKLADLPPLYKESGYNSWVAWYRGWGEAQGQYGFTPVPPGYDPFKDWTNPWASAQRGMEYVPRTMPVQVHKGEMIVPAGPAQQMRESAVNITIQHLSVSGGRAGARQFVNAVEEELGQGIRARSR